MHAILCREYGLIDDLVERTAGAPADLAERRVAGKLIVVP